jgi:mannose-6-phosphate isomerase-like protein (cupin superfamily)
VDHRPPDPLVRPPAHLGACCEPSYALTRGDVPSVARRARRLWGGPPPHVHRERDEGFYVLEGRYRFEYGDAELTLEPGEFVFVPRGTRHHFRTLLAPSRTLIFVAPAGLEGFF